MCWISKYYFSDDLFFLLSKSNLPQPLPASQSTPSSFMMWLRHPDLVEIALSVAAAALVVALIGLIIRFVKHRRKPASGEEYLDLIYRQHAPFGRHLSPGSDVTLTPPARRRRRAKRPSRSAVPETAEKTVREALPGRVPGRTSSSGQTPDKASAEDIKQAAAIHRKSALATVETWRRALAGGDTTLAVELENSWKASPLSVSVSTLLALACTDTRPIRKEAQRILSELNPEVSLPLLIAALETASGDDGDVIGSVLEKIGDPRAAEPLLRFTQRQAGELFGAGGLPFGGVAGSSARGPAGVPGGKTDPQLDEARSQVRDNLKEKAYLWLKERFDKLEPDSLEKGTPKALALIETMGSLGDERMAEVLLPIWKQAEGDYKETVFDALIKVAPPGLSDELLLEVMAQEQPLELPPFADAVDNRIDSLKKMYSSDDEFRRLEAITSVEEDLGENGVTFLIEALNDASWAVRYAAVETLSKYRKVSAKARKALKKALTDSSAKVRAMAESAMEEKGAERRKKQQKKKPRKKPKKDMNKEQTSTDKPVESEQAQPKKKKSPGKPGTGKPGKKKKKKRKKSAASEKELLEQAMKAVEAGKKSAKRRKTKKPEQPSGDLPEQEKEN